MHFDEMNAMQRRLHNAACVIEAEGDEHGFAKLQRDAIAEIQRLREWIATEGTNSDTCTRNVLGRVCDGCRCGRAVVDA